MPAADVPIQSPSPRSSGTSLAAAASANAANLSRQPSRSSARSSRPSFSERRRSAVLNEDPSLPGPGELQGGSHRSSMGYAFRTASPTSLGGSPTIPTGDPHHQRTPSLGELHQELEQEQEAQVNRLLQMIRSQQMQLQQLQQQQSSNGGTAVIDDSTPNSERSASIPIPSVPPPGGRTSLSVRRGSRSNQTTSPRLAPLTSSSQGSVVEPIRSHDGSELPGLGEARTRSSSRDETAFFQAEAASLTRENQLLRQRIRELERQIGEMTTDSSGAHQPTSHLATASSVEGTEQAVSTDVPGAENKT
ncbi:hypothetical protein PAAG_06225 [Paecilomyces variotii No. 5]|uniref:Uncharacterized protein n=1 Tax=Byssochlamys spectabilis (strain No. 5 / NBRC 109023) TaxID=1356009 RepID=V5I654_BYSSN|nr:hypothetical protein PAAG_06225 [Paecilomyces variotii No. 5]